MRDWTIHEQTPRFVPFLVPLSALLSRKGYANEDDDDDADDDVVVAVVDDDYADNYDND